MTLTVEAVFAAAEVGAAALDEAVVAATDAVLEAAASAALDRGAEADGILGCIGLRRPESLRSQLVRLFDRVVERRAPERVFRGASATPRRRRGCNASGRLWQCT